MNLTSSTENLKSLQQPTQFPNCECLAINFIETLKNENCRKKTDLGVAKELVVKLGGGNEGEEEEAEEGQTVFMAHQ